jgi:hypothetical protein
MPDPKDRQEISETGQRLPLVFALRPQSSAMAFNAFCAATFATFAICHIGFKMFQAFLCRNLFCAIKAGFNRPPCLKQMLFWVTLTLLRRLPKFLVSLFCPHFLA